MALQIITIDSQKEKLLRTNAERIETNEWPLALEIAEQLFLALKPYIPAAGLAAPQIGISKAIFIFSFDRDPKNLEVVINPSFEPISEIKTEGWEACFSVILSQRDWKVAKIARYETIRATYLNREEKKIEKVLDGFAAKVFQHECDHLQGIVNIDRKDAILKSFNSKEELLTFMESIKKSDVAKYKKPQ